MKPTLFIDHNSGLLRILEVTQKHVRATDTDFTLGKNEIENECALLHIYSTRKALMMMIELLLKMRSIPSPVQPVLT